MQELAEYFREVGGKGKRVLILGHPHPDPDAVGSMIALGDILDSLGAEVVLGVPSNFSRLSRSVLDLVDQEIETDPVLEADLVVVLDTSGWGHLKEYGERVKNEEFEDVVFIDHHRPDEETRKSVDKYLVEEDVTSTTELVVRLAEELDFELDSDLATLMLTGIISDTGHFKFANSDTFEAVTSLLRQGASYRRALDSLEIEEDPSKRVAMLKAARRMDIHKAYGRWIAFSDVGAYESDAASLFLKAGADVSLVASVDDEVRMSGRARSGLASETNLHLGELMSDLADRFGGTGGGHAGAAAMTVRGDLEEVKEVALEKLKKMLKPKK